MAKRLKGGRCPNCQKFLIRKRSIRSRKPKPTTCGNCGHKILDPYKIFKPKKPKYVT